MLQRASEFLSGLRLWNFPRYDCITCYLSICPSADNSDGSYLLAIVNNTAAMNTGVQTSLSCFFFFPPWDLNMPPKLGTTCVSQSLETVRGPEERHATLVGLVQLLHADDNSHQSQ